MMSNHTKNWKEFFSHTYMNETVALLNAATKALDISINHEGKIIHPGAFITFCNLLHIIIDITEAMANHCKEADLDSFYKNDHPENESGRAE